jgi:hypothetical protein
MREAAFSADSVTVGCAFIFFAIGRSVCSR